jgi:hypothetical protein
MTDDLGTLQRPYRVEGRRLCQGDAEYNGQLWLEK